MAQCVSPLAYINLSSQLQSCSAAVLNSLRLVLLTFGMQPLQLTARPSCSGPGKDAAMSMFCVLLCNMIPAHHILPAGGVEEVSAAASSSCVSLGILVALLPQRDASQIMSWPLFCSVSLRCSLSHTAILCLSVFFFFLSPPSLSFSLPSICACRWTRTGSATSTTCGSTLCRTCWDTSTPTPSPSSLEAQLTSHYAPMYKCSEAPAQVHNTQT